MYIREYRVSEWGTVRLSVCKVIGRQYLSTTFVDIFHVPSLYTTVIIA